MFLQLKFRTLSLGAVFLTPCKHLRSSALRFPGALFVKKLLKGRCHSAPTSFISAVVTALCFLTFLSLQTAAVVRVSVHVCRFFCASIHFINIRHCAGFIFGRDQRRIDFLSLTSGSSWAGKGVNECGGTWATPSSRYVVEYYGKIERIVTFLGVRKGLIEKR